MAAAQLISGIAASTMVMLRALHQCDELTMVAHATPRLACCMYMECTSKEADASHEKIRLVCVPECEHHHGAAVALDLGAAHGHPQDLFCILLDMQDPSSQTARRTALAVLADGTHIV